MRGRKQARECVPHSSKGQLKKMPTVPVSHDALSDKLIIASAFRLVINDASRWHQFPRTSMQTVAGLTDPSHDGAVTIE
jgi:hypothetical protein